MASGETSTRPRRRLSADERRTQLSAAAVEALAEHGFRGTSADEIARRAGVSKGLLWHYFADLDDLMQHTARAALHTIVSGVAAGLDLTAPVPELIRAAVHAAARARLTHARERRALEEIVMNLRTPDGSQRLTLDDYEEMYAGQERLFRRGQEEGDVRPDLDPRVLAVTYQGAVDAMLGFLDRHPELDADAYADTVADVLLSGLAR